MSATFRCAGHCGTLVRAVYCDDCSEKRKRQELAARVARSEAMAERWASDREGMLSRLKDARENRPRKPQEARALFGEG